jgi:hypothetical protein
MLQNGDLQKTFCVIQFAKTNSVIMMQRESRSPFGIDPQVRYNDLLLLSCPYAIGLLGRPTSPRATSFAGGS